MRQLSLSVITSLILSFLLGCHSSEEGNQNSSGKKNDGYVPDALTAKKIAEAVWLPIYGTSVLDEKPYQARIIGDSVWIVEGVLDHGKSGGTAYIEIRMKDGTVLKVTHGK
jgi:hypothetical protein